jgi:hypothetical protein
MVAPNSTTIVALRSRTEKGRVHIIKTANLLLRKSCHEALRLSHARAHDGLSHDTKTI